VRTTGDRPSGGSTGPCSLRPSTSLRKFPSPRPRSLQLRPKPTRSIRRHKSNCLTKRRSPVRPSRPSNRKSSTSQGTKRTESASRVRSTRRRHMAYSPRSKRGRHGLGQARTRFPLTVRSAPRLGTASPKPTQNKGDRPGIKGLVSTKNKPSNDPMNPSPRR
jgi:hypothetical protein